MDIGPEGHWAGWTLGQMDIGPDGNCVGQTLGQMYIIESDWTFGLSLSGLSYCQTKSWVGWTWILGQMIAKPNLGLDGHGFQVRCTSLCHLFRCLLGHMDIIGSDRQWVNLTQGQTLGCMDIGLDGQWLFSHLVEGTLGQTILSEEH